MTTFQQHPGGRVSHKSQEDGNNTIGISTDITIVGINGDQPIRAKVDTGADYCSLHALNVQIKNNPYSIDQGDSVVFEYNERRYTAPVVDYQSISSADGGVTNRPVVSFSVRVNDRYVEEVLFNLNDRSDMEFPVLIGLNLLNDLGVNVDPTVTESSEPPIETDIPQFVATGEDDTGEPYTNDLTMLIAALRSCPNVTITDLIEGLTRHETE
jgi:hypothetical protein